MFPAQPVPAWQLKLLIQPILDTPSLESSATRLALRSEEIMRNARDQALLGELEISSAMRGFNGKYDDHSESEDR